MSRTWRSTALRVGNTSKGKNKAEAALDWYRHSTHQQDRDKHMQTLFDKHTHLGHSAATRVWRAVDKGF